MVSSSFQRGARCTSQEQRAALGPDREELLRFARGTSIFSDGAEKACREWGIDPFEEL
jgi:hypothetical protein